MQEKGPDVTVEVKLYRWAATGPCSLKPRWLKVGTQKKLGMEAVGNTDGTPMITGTVRLTSPHHAVDEAIGIQGNLTPKRYQECSLLTPFCRTLLDFDLSFKTIHFSLITLKLSSSIIETTLFWHHLGTHVSLTTNPPQANEESDKTLGNPLLPAIEHRNPVREHPLPKRHEGVNY